jgi:hypothetical protein
VYWRSEGSANSEFRSANDGEEVLSFTLNQDSETATKTPRELVALVQAWQAGVIYHESVLNLMRRGLGTAVPKATINENNGPS